MTFRECPLNPVVETTRASRVVRKAFVDDSRGKSAFDHGIRSIGGSVVDDINCVDWASLGEKSIEALAEERFAVVGDNNSGDGPVSFEGGSCGIGGMLVHWIIFFVTRVGRGGAPGLSFFVCCEQ